MRLWHEALLPYLPRQQLLGQHRECCALRGRGWGRNHSVVNYVFTHPRAWLWEYHIRVMDEMQRRGYHPDIKWANMFYRGTTLPMLTEYQEEDIVHHEGYVYPEHNDEYLEECLQNLEGKGINLREVIKNE